MLTTTTGWREITNFHGWHVPYSYGPPGERHAGRRVEGNMVLGRKEEGGGEDMVLGRAKVGIKMGEEGGSPLCYSPNSSL